MKLLIGLSGGVDSSLSALLLRDGGYSVVGGALVMHDESDTSGAAQAAESLGLPFYTLDCSAEFDREVAEYLVTTYASGRTPSPCVVCNRRLKLEMLCRLADECGCEKIATGHYASVGCENGRYYISRSPDPKKDQSYFLCMATQRQLSRLVLPLASFTKAETRELAKSYGLAAAEKKDSQELCFIPDGDYAAYIEARRGKFPEGDYISPEGKVCGRHGGIIRCTIGQRKGLGIALGRPVFVSRIDPVTNRVYLADAGGEYSAKAQAVNLSFQLLEPPKKDITLRAFVKHRAAAQPIPCTLDIIYNKSEENCADNDGNSAHDGNYAAEVTFDTPARAVTPGQFLCAYDEHGRILCAGELV